VDSQASGSRSPHRILPFVLGGYAVVLFCFAAWIVAAEINRSAPSNFPADASTAEAVSAGRSAATVAASMGLVRGDLRADEALTYLSEYWRDSPDAKALNEAREVTAGALRLSPHDARTWLVLAAIEARRSNGAGEVAALRMSYYTASNDLELVPFRLRLAVRTDAIAEQEFGDLARHDIRIIALRNDMAALGAAYRDASPAGRRFIEAALDEIAPALKAQLR